MSKFSRDLLEYSLYGPLSRQKEDPTVLLGSRFGEDVALVDGGGCLIASHVDPIVGAAEAIGRLAVHVACNDLGASAIRPRWLQLLVLLPRQKDRDELKRIMDDAVEAAREVGASIVGGHSGYTDALSRPLVAVTAFGVAEGPVMRTGGAQKGDKICLTQGAGLEGTAILAADYEGEALRLGLTAEEIARGRDLSAFLSVVPEGLALAAAGATAIHDPTRGGVVEALLEMAEASGKAFHVTATAIPVPPVVRRFADVFAFDPLRMISSGTLVVTVPAEKLPQALRAAEDLDLPFAVIGTVQEGRGVHLCRSDGTVLLEEPLPEQDELARLQELLGPPGSFPASQRALISSTDRGGPAKKK